ncbi:S8 family serine peptidase [Streptomyces sp. NPDC012769]|uniref:S8 family serine peptidase n=1 Tax=Streptomyces sp. NPDC012769 TaxID=3364848 RepID=UPI0036CE2E4B
MGLAGPAQASEIRPRQQSIAAAGSETAAPDQRVTLITGDRITLQGGDPSRAAIDPGAGRGDVTFRTHRLKDHLYVVPSDVQDEIASGRLDRRLFDVTGLIKAGYDDRSTTAIPVIVTYADHQKAEKTPKRSAAPGTTVTRRLPGVNGAAMKVDKAKTGAFLTGATSARSTTGVDRIWLDGKREISLDRSVPQIGAPTAWQAGYTGKGVSVAVLDTGIDASHPDLAGRVAGAKNFTDETAEDLVGHGTHVASTIAGTAAASDGRYKGVAPDATLYDGKVCEQFGCPESAILSGMEWAANEVHAKIVNLSLGGPDTPETDPLEEAVDRLTAQTGTLFVIAAGNGGPDERTVDSPGSADAALTVGAVDGQDGLAGFSGRGPRVGDGAIKPDVTAPGVGIVAAKATKSSIGTPVGDHYLRLDGTSMATPHTAGAAALLAQRHPDWTPAELKGALMASAKPAAGQTAFQQGAGRVDVAKGITQSVIAEPGSISFGTASSPHDDDTPVTRTLTYRNLGDQPVTLDLTATLAGPDGAPAPAGAIRLSAHTLTVAAGGTASVQATSDTNHSGPDGGYSGRITATGGDITVGTAIAVVMEEESYDLTVTSVGPDGEPTAASGVVFGLDKDVFTWFYEADGTSKLRLPKGEYALQSTIDFPAPDGQGEASYQLVQPSLRLTENTSAVLDARNAKPVKVTMPQSEAEVAIADIGYLRRSADGLRRLDSGSLFRNLDHVYTAQVGASLPPEQMSSHISSQWGRRSADGTFTKTPYLYSQLDTVRGGFPTGFQRDVETEDLAVVDQTINASSDRRVERIVYGDAPDAGGAWAVGLTNEAPITTKLLLVGDDSVTWRTRIEEVIPHPDPNNPMPITISALTTRPTHYTAGRTYSQRLNAAVFSPAPITASRTGDLLHLSAGAALDADGNMGGSLTDSQYSKLYRDGQLIAEEPFFGSANTSGLPAGEATYRLETSQTRQTYSTFSTRTDLTWTFSSAATTRETLLPMLAVRYKPNVDSENAVDRRPVTALPVEVAAQPGASLPDIRKLEIQVSGDDGKTWRKAMVVPTGKGTYTAIFPTPRDAGTVSLKAHLIDAAGGVTDQTVIAAYPLR